MVGHVQKKVVFSKFDFGDKAKKKSKPTPQQMLQMAERQEEKMKVLKQKDPAKVGSIKRGREKEGEGKARESALRPGQQVILVAVCRRVKWRKRQHGRRLCKRHLAKRYTLPALAAGVLPHTRLPCQPWLGRPLNPTPSAQVFDDSSLVKKRIKRIEKQKSKSTKAWFVKTVMASALL